MSFEVAMTALGGHGLYIRPGDIHLGKREDLKDTAVVMSRFCDGIVIRSAHYADILEPARYSSVPVINGMADDRNHPTQALCDVFTMYEIAGRLEGIHLAFVGDTGEGFGVIGRDLLLISSKPGIHISCASPPEYMVDEPYLRMVRQNGEGRLPRVLLTGNDRLCIIRRKIAFMRSSPSARRSYRKRTI